MHGSNIGVLWRRAMWRVITALMIILSLIVLIIIRVIYTG